MNIGGHRSALLVVVLGLGVLAFAGTPAQARQARLFHGTFGSAASTVPDPYPLQYPQSVAVDTSGGPSNGDVYVSDERDRVEKFDSAGHFLLMFGKEVNKTAVEEARASEEDVCPAAGHPGDTCQPGTRGSTPGAFAGSEFSALYLAVDPTSGDVYVADPADDLISKFDSAGNLIPSWAAGGQLDGSSAPEGPFHELSSIVIDHSGNLWAMSTRNLFSHGVAAQVSEFRPDSSFATGWNTENEIFAKGLGQAGHFLAVDSEDNLYFIEENGVGGAAVKYTAAGVRIGQVTADQRSSGEEHVAVSFYSLTLDSAANDLYVAASLASPGSSAFVQRYPQRSCPLAGASSCEVAETFGQGRLGTGSEVKGLAVDPTALSDTLYAVSASAADVTAFAVQTVPDVATVKASGFGSGSATLNGTVNPSSVTLSECAFEWGEKTEPYEHTAPCEPSAASIPADSNSHAVKAQIGGLQAGHTYHFRLLAGNANTVFAEEPSVGQDLSFGPPLLLSTSALDASSSTATLQAQLTPNNIETTYRFEYDTSPYGEGEGPHGTSTPDASAGSGSSDLTGTVPLEGLKPGTVYYYRLVAENVLGAVTGPGHSFTTQPVAAFGLPDDRGWELVSPPEKGGSTLEAFAHEGAVIQAAADGSALTYVANGSMGPGAPGNRGGIVLSQFLANRTPAGWTNQDITPPHEEPVGFRPGWRTDYRLFSPDLSFAALDPEGATALSPATTEPTPYLRHDATGEYEPLLTASNVQPWAKFGSSFVNGRLINEANLVAASPDLQGIVVASCASLTAEAIERCQEGHDNSPTELFEWRHGELVPVSVLPGGTSAQAAGLSPTVGGADVGGKFLRHAVSAGGRRVIFTTKSGSGKEALYLRDVEVDETVRVDSPQQGAAGGGQPFFQDASADGSRVFFTDDARLTVDSTAQSGEPDLYMCEVTVGENGLACALKDLTVDHNPGEAADVWPITLGASADGSRVYFVANGVLASDATAGDCVRTTGSNLAAQCNLYVADTATGILQFVSDVSRRDLSSSGIETNRGGLAFLTSRVSPNGRFFAFMSALSLTGYDNRDAVSGRTDEEVYLYDAAGADGEGKLICASCNPTGARPHGVLDPGGYPGLLSDRTGIWTEHWLAASIPGWTHFNLGPSLYQSRYLSDSGRLFFDSADALVSQDSNGTGDVYQYESPEGGEPSQGSCTQQSPTYSSASAGCVSLISSGTSGEESAFLDASESGNDVFFLTAAQLSHTDQDTALDVYDARVGGGEPEPVKPPICEGDACQSPVSAPDDPTPGSLTFHSPGNLLTPVSASVIIKARPSDRARRLARALKVCKRKPKRERATCVRRAQRAYGRSVKVKRSNRETKSSGRGR